MTIAATWVKHRPLARSIARGYFWAGAESQDVEQEALIGLWIAARDFNGTGSFKAWANFVIERRLVECVRASKRGKQRPLNDSLRVVQSIDETSYESIVEHLPHWHQVADVAEESETLAAVVRSIRDDLTPMERTAVVGIASGLSYAEIDLPYKSIDNALVRARAKLRAAA